MRSPSLCRLVAFAPPPAPRGWRIGAIILLLTLSGRSLQATTTWDGRHDTSRIEATVVYFVPSDRRPLPDWKERAEYYCRRIELFHEREFQGQSILDAQLHPQPLISGLTTRELRSGTADAIFFRTLGEADQKLGISQRFSAGSAEDQGKTFPVLLVLSDINWRPLDDFYRLRPDGDQFEFEGNYRDGEHFPGAASGGARATYLADRGLGWGLVSADGWRVPYRGSDCVVYHEGCGHTVGLPHPPEANGSVMSLGQYRGWLSESWLDREQKLRLGWQPADEKREERPELEMFSRFRALPVPRVPRPGEEVQLELRWPEDVRVESLRVRYQTAIDAPWIEVPRDAAGDAPATVRLGKFDRPTPVSYRVDARLTDGRSAELWGYFQVRGHPDENPLPYSLSPDLVAAATQPHPGIRPGEPSSKEVDLLSLADPARCWHVGSWSREQEKLVAPKHYGARLELPYSPPAEYRLVAVVEPLDEPDGLILGHRAGDHRFLTLLNYTPDATARSAVENVDGRNVGNATTFEGPLFKQHRLSQVIVTVGKQGVNVMVDGRPVIHWQGSPDRLSLSDYWKTPDDRALFVGAYDCRYRFHRLTLEPLSGEGKRLGSEPTGGE